MLAFHIALFVLGWGGMASESNLNVTQKFFFGTNKIQILIGEVAAFLVCSITGRDSSLNYEKPQ